MVLADKKRIHAAKVKRYHTLKLVEGIAKDKGKVAGKHLARLVENRILNKIKFTLENDKLV